MLTLDDAADLVEELLPAKIHSRQLGLEKIPRKVVSTSIAEGSEPSEPSDDDKVKSGPSTQFKSKFYSSVRSPSCLLSFLHYPYCIFTCLPSFDLSMYSVSDDRPDEPHIAEEAFFRGGILLSGDIEMRILKEPLKDYGILDETSFHVLRSVRRYRRRLFYLDQMHYLMYVLGKRENGLQILFRCLKETQHRVPDHRRIVQELESKGG